MNATPAPPHAARAPAGLAPGTPLRAGSSVLLLVDLQARLLPALDGGGAALSRAVALAAGARLLGVPVLATEQAPESLGPTAPALAPHVDRVVTKRAFDATAEPALPAALAPGRAVLVAGAEAHVCVLQTALGLLAAGRRVLVAADAVASRRAADRAAGLARLERAGAEVVTSEMALFEWLERADHPRFREALAIIKPL